MKVYRLTEVEVPDDLRSWGGYDGKYCAECPYFLASNLLYDYERSLLKHLAEELAMSVDDLLEMLTAEAQPKKERF